MRVVFHRSVAILILNYGFLSETEVLSWPKAICIQRIFPREIYSFLSSELVPLTGNRTNFKIRRNE